MNRSQQKIAKNAKRDDRLELALAILVLAALFVAWAMDRAGKRVVIQDSFNAVGAEKSESPHVDSYEISR